jgi:hypothetical protein
MVCMRAARLNSILTRLGALFVGVDDLGEADPLRCVKGEALRRRPSLGVMTMPPGSYLRVL